MQISEEYFIYWTRIWTLKISIEGEEFFDEFDKTIIRYNLNLDDIKQECPNLHNELLLLSQQDGKFCTD